MKLMAVLKFIRRSKSGVGIIILGQIKTYHTFALKKMKSCFWFIIGFVVIATLISCNLSQIEEFEVGQDFIDSNSGVVLIDTMSISTSTTRVDSIVTSELSGLLVGGYRNSSTGTMTCSPFFEINSGSFTIDDDDLVYDSLVVRLSYNGYYIGDTTKQISFNVKQVAEELKLNDDGYLYNTSSFQMDSESLGGINFYPQPHSINNLYVRLSDKLGEKLFNNIINKNDTMSNSSYFQEYFKGMALVSNENQNQSAVGFSHDSVSVRVYYHEEVKTTESKEKTYFSFPVSSSDVWYNQIKHNANGSLLELIGQHKNELPSSSTSDLTMVQSGSGIYTKIRIPGVDYLKGYGKNVVFIASKIQITPLRDSYSEMNPLPDSLSVYIADRNNRITSQLSNSLGYVYASKVVPAGFDKLPYYEIDITPFFTSEMTDLSIAKNSLLIGSVASKSGSTINPIVFSQTSSEKEIIKLHVYCYIDKSK